MHAERIAPHVAERITRAQDMLARLGERKVYEPNYAREKLADAARCCLEALALLGEGAIEIENLASVAHTRGHDHAEALRRLEQMREAQLDGRACIRCGERDGALEVAGVGERGQVFEHAECRADGLAANVEFRRPRPVG